MKDVTPNETLAFFRAMEKNNIPYRATPRTKEEIDNLIFVHNSTTKEYYSLPKGTQLSPEETIVTSADIFAQITTGIDTIVNETDDFTK
ncbi:MAG: hypothetical protein E7354_00655 [Clostridiales bacterium]|nr:hypothetical protein [Clostridiales bacterium]